jgi:hypothetical protein
VERTVARDYITAGLFRRDLSRESIESGMRDLLRLGADVTIAGEPIGTFACKSR